MKFKKEKYCSTYHSDCGRFRISKGYWGQGWELFDKQNVQYAYRGGKPSSRVQYNFSASRLKDAKNQAIKILKES